MRLATLIAAACLGLAASAAADGKEGKTYDVPPVTPLEATGLTAIPVSAPPNHELGVYRFGATFAYLPGSTPLACEAVCVQDNQCQAWSFVDVYGAAPARCELKGGQGRKEENPLAISGVSPHITKSIYGEAPAPQPVSLPTGPDGLKGGVASVEEAAPELETARMDAALNLRTAPAPSLP